MIEWEKVSLGEVAKVQTGPFGSQLKNEQYVTGGTPVITVEHIDDFKIKDFDYPSVTNEDRDRLSKYLLKEGDIVFTRVGSVELSAYVSKNQDGWMFSSRMLSVRPIKKVDSKYLSYFFRQPSFRKYIFKISVGATMPSINTSILKSIPISYPPLPEQKAIANVLTAFDDKIELLQQQNQTLESLAQTIFKEWFGKYQIGDDLPEGWRVGKIEDLTIRMSSGGTPSTKRSDFYGDEIFWFSTKELQDNFLLGCDKKISQLGLDNSSAKLFPKHTVLMAIYAAPTVGRLGILTKEASFNQAAVGLVADELFGFEFVYLLLKSLRVELNNLSNGAAQQNLNVGLVKNYKISIPPKVLLKQFRSVITPLFNKMEINTQQIQSLTKTRDTLLPKLMSGQVRVKM
ncbi:restriction endonuclease subunit S [Lutibacter sp. A80]|uniref:restriction endonuclease subunit S n=1 Tax=Lutibacter sp. A80 TaxID=2918453 RepID=UPI001F0576E5|nr:restriction endonuclease subunit S [Lutibacter sp. A80]UMB59897.1 restriction endonuclease subunit S [Lutibacter sp. A80]